MSENKSATKPELGILEEDDEFEEFPAEGMWSLIYFAKIYFVNI